MFDDFTEPPYSTRTTAAVSSPYFSATNERTSEHTSCASAEDAVRYRPLLLERLARWVRVVWQKVTLRRPRQRWRARRKP